MHPLLEIKNLKTVTFGYFRNTDRQVYYIESPFKFESEIM